MAHRVVLIVTMHFPPSSASGSFRMLGFAQQLPRHGWRAVVVAPPTLPWEPIDPELLDLVPAETTVLHVPYPRNRVVRRLAMFSGWLALAIPACWRAIREYNPEVILTSGPPHRTHLLGLWLKRRYGLPLVTDFRDPWYPKAQLNRGLAPTSRPIRVQEAMVVRAADAVIANTPGSRESFLAEYPGLQGRCVTISNGYEPAAFEGLPGPARRSPRAPLRVVHAGAIYLGRDPRPFLEAVKRLGLSGVQVEAHFLGPPPESGLDLNAEALALGIPSQVKVLGQVSYRNALRAMAGAHINLLLDSPGRLVGVPAKLYEYVGAGRPVLVLASGGAELASVLHVSGIPHRVVAPNDPANIAAAIRELAGESAAQVRRLHGNRERFSRERTAADLAALLDRCSAKPTG